MRLIKNIIKSFDDFKILKEKLQTVNQNNGLINSIRIYLTESCNANCNHCFNKGIREDRHMDTAKAEMLFNYFASNGIKNLKIMGGEPTVHPDFLTLYNLSQQKFDSVALFTNGLNAEITKITPRNTDAIIYNFLFINRQFDSNKYLPSSNFARIFEIVIDGNTDIQKLKNEIQHTQQELSKKRIQQYYFQITLNCIEQIFIKKEDINRKFREIISFILSKYPNHISFDHTIPLCFWEEESINLMNKYNLSYYKATCRGTDFGLVDSKFNLLHCNQFQEVITPIFINDKTISFIRLNNLLKIANLNKKIFNLKNKCIDCQFFDTYCTGGCLAHKRTSQ